ncbi:hypothetical protein M1555_04700 [Patescibacteria group bacterium]|nr:hypothetical protein [Patescibacteria group bacterium]
MAVRELDESETAIDGMMSELRAAWQAIGDPTVPGAFLELDLLEQSVSLALQKLGYSPQLARAEMERLAYYHEMVGE